MYNSIKLELIRPIKINNFEKNPINGGTPAIENNETAIIVVKNVLNLKSTNEAIVLKPLLTVCWIVQKRISKVVL